MAEISRASSKKIDVDPAAHPFLRIAAVSYEGSLFGWNIEENAEQVELTSRLTFGFNVSIGTMKAIAVSQSGKYLVVGGMDERIRIYDMHSNKAVGELSQHTGAITSLKFFKDSYLISASEDFNLCIWRVYDWQCVHILGGHKDTILDFSIHPTGKMAMSVSKDHTLKLWNLVQGRCAFTRRLKAPTEQVIWHEETGDYYLLVSHRDIQLFKAADNSIVATLTHGSRINRACFTSVTTTDDADPSSSYRMVTVCDNKTINMFDFSGKQTCCVDLSPLGAARPRDVSSSAPNVAAVKSPEMLEVVEQDSQVLTVATSLGQVIVLSVSALERLGVRTDTSGQAVDTGSSNEEQDKEEDVELAVLSNHQIRAEPRLTALVSWNSATAATIFATKGSKRPSHMLESEGNTTTSNMQSEEVDTDDDSVDSEIAEAKKSTNKKGNDKKKAQVTGKDTKSAVVKGKKGEENKKVKFDNDRSSNDKKRKQDGAGESHVAKKVTIAAAPSTKNAKQAKNAKASNGSDDEGPAKVISFEDAYPSNDRAGGKGGKKQDNNKKNKSKNYAQRRSIHEQK